MAADPDGGPGRDEGPDRDGGPDRDPVGDGDSLRDLVADLLVRDRDVHAEAVAALAERGDERVVPHLVELVVIDAIAADWERFGFPEVLRARSPPRHLELPEASWPGVGDALAAVAGPSFDSDYAWVEWESWYSQQSIEPLAGFDEWKLQLYRSYLPPVGGLLDVEPRAFDLQDVRWGNCDRSFLAALNGPDFVPGEAVEVADDAGEARGEAVEATSDAADGPGDAGEAGVPERYLADDDLVFGFTVADRAYAVPRWVLFPHELLNATLEGVPLSLSYCTLCNAPICYDRRVDGDVLTFGSTGLLLRGNKVMFDEETESLWSQHRGVAIAGEHAERGTVLSHRAVTQTDWAAWRAEHPDALALDIATGYDYDYRFYDGRLGIFRHYWEDEDVVQPGVRREASGLPEKAPVYGVTGDDPDAVWVFPVEAVRERGALAGRVDGRDVVAVTDATGDVAVYEAPPLPASVEDEGLVDADGTRWTATRDALVTGGDRRERVAGRHGLWFAFRAGYGSATVVGGDGGG